MKAVVWGAGGKTKEFLLRPIMNFNYEIVAIVDNNKERWGEKFGGYEIISPQEMIHMAYDVVIICSIYANEIIKQLIYELKVAEHKIITYEKIDKEICNGIVEKYKDVDDLEICETLKEFKKGQSSILGAYNPPFSSFSEVYRDDEGWPYILFEGKRMYYPFNYIFTLKEGKEVVPDIMYEQGEDSPHRYLSKGYSMPKDAIIVDAGVCEGNFALRFVDIAKKIYLIESDDQWMDALKRTFKSYQDKVVFVNKFLSARNNSREITLDTLVNGRLDFLKMDIEGAEIEALLGARQVLTKNNVQCAICSYHRQYDGNYIGYILKSYGYQVKPSKGYIFFPYDENMIDTLDLRRGVIYGFKI